MTYRKKAIFWSSAAAILVALGIIVIVVGLTEKKLGDVDRTVYIETTDIQPAKLKPDNLAEIFAADQGIMTDCFERTYLFIVLSPTLFDPTTMAYKFRAQFTPCGDNLLYDGTKAFKSVGSAPVLQGNVSVGIGTRSFSFQSGQVMPIQDWNGIFDSGDLNHYPFENYESYASYITGSYSFFDGKTTQKLDLPVALTISGNLQSYKLTVTGVTSNTSDIGLSFDFKVQRAVAGKFFSVMIMIIMWILSLLAITMSVTINTRGRKVEPPTMAVHVALLFALPGIRNTQPGSPPIGCISDVVSFFWAMSIVSLSVMLLFLNYIIKYQKEKK